MNSSKILAWQSLAWPSSVILAFSATDTELSGTGVAAGKTDQDLPFAYRYAVTLSPDWQVRTVSIASLLDDRGVTVQHDSGTWRNAAGGVLPEFDGIPFVDIAISPFTNSIPIKLLDFHGGEPQKIPMVYFDENSFSLRKTRQQYSRIGPRTYRYQDIELSDFTADLNIDDDGLVVDFDRLFKRI